MSLVIFDQVYDPQTGEQSRTVVSDDVVTGIVSYGATNATKRTLGAERRHEATVLVRESDLGILRVSGRAFVINLQWFDVTGLQRQAGGLVRLELTSASPAGVSQASGSGGLDSESSDSGVAA